jgi:hypothetical protein
LPPVSCGAASWGSASALAALARSSASRRSDAAEKRMVPSLRTSPLGASASSSGPAAPDSGPSARCRSATSRRSEAVENRTVELLVTAPVSGSSASPSGSGEATGGGAAGASA